MATLSSILYWRIPWTEEPCGLQSLGRKELDTSDRLTHTHTHTHTHTLKKTIKTLLYSTGNSAPYSVMTCAGEESKKEWICVCV